MADIKDTVPASALNSSFRTQVYKSESAREVRARAEFIQQSETREERIGIERLKRLKSLQTEFDQNAPRGYYLNIRV